MSSSSTGSILLAGIFFLVAWWRFRPLGEVARGGVLGFAPEINPKGNAAVAVGLIFFVRLRKGGVALTRGWRGRVCVDLRGSFTNFEQFLSCCVATNRLEKFLAFPEQELCSAAHLMPDAADQLRGEFRTVRTPLSAASAQVS